MRKSKQFLLIAWGVALFLGIGTLATAEETQTQEKVLEDIFVRESTFDNPATPASTRYGTQYNQVTEEQIRQQNTYDFQSTLKNVPGVMFQSKNLMGSQTSHSLYIRGRGASHPSSDFAVLFDGVPRFGALFGQVLGDGIAVSTIGGMEVYKSPQPSQFGNGYALVSVMPKYIKEEGQELNLDFSGGSYGTFSQALSGGLKSGSFDFYLSESSAVTDGHRDNSNAEQLNYYANTGYRINDAWNVRLLVNSVNSETEAPMPDTLPTSTNGVSWPGAERYDTQTLLSTLTLNHQYDHCEGFLKVYQNQTDFDLIQELTNGQRYGGGTGGLWSRQEISLYGIRAKEALHLWRGGEILMGVDLDKTELENTQQTYSGLAVAGINGGLAKRTWNFPDTTLVSPFLAVSQYVGKSDGFHFIPSTGIRHFDHNEFESKTTSQAGLVAGYGHTDLHFNYSRGVNYPSPVAVMNAVVNTTTITDPEQFWESIKPEVVDHYELGITHDWPETASLTASAFLDKGKDRFRAYMFGSMPVLFNDPIGRYEIRGLELSGTVKPAKSLEFFSGATWLDAEAEGSDGITRDKMPYTPDFQFQAGVTWTFLENCKLYLDMQHLKDLYQGTAFRTQGFNFAELGAQDKLDDITLFNARISWRFDYLPLRLKGSEAFLGVNNIFNQEYEYAKGYDMPGATIFAGMTLRFR